MELYLGTLSAVPLPSSGVVSVYLPPAEFSLPLSCAIVPVRARVVCCAATSFVFPRRFLRFPTPFYFPPSVFPLIRVPSCSVWGTWLTHRPRHRHVTQTQAALQHSHIAVLHIDVGPHSQQVLTARKAECIGAVVCSTSAAPFYFPPFSSSSFTERHAWFAWPYPYLTPSITRGDVSDVTPEFRRVTRWLYVFPTRRFSRNFSKV